MPSIHTLFDKKVRETAGAQTNARYQFQAHVALLKVCDLHEKASDYSVVLDHFDDVVVVQRTAAGEVLDFYQVKTRNSGRWTIRALTIGSKEAPPPASIIGKMYQNAAIFGSATGSISFLSDAGFDVQDSSGTPFPPGVSRIPASSLASSQIQQIEDSLDADFPPPRSPPCKGILFLEQSPMTVAGQATFVTGRLVQMLSSIGEDDNLPVKALYETLFASASAKSARTGVFPDDASFYEAKSLARSEIDALIARASAPSRFGAWWPALASELAAAGYTTAAALAFQNRCLRYMRSRAAAQFRPTSLGEAVAAKLPTPLTEAHVGSSILDYAAAIAASMAAETGAKENEIVPIGVVEVLEKLHADAA